MGSRKIAPKPSKDTPSTKKRGNAKKAAKQPTQRTPMERIMVMGPTGKKRMEWRPWGS